MIELHAKAGGGKVFVSPDQIGAIEEGESGSRLTIQGQQIVVSESIPQILVALQTRDARPAGRQLFTEPADG